MTLPPSYFDSLYAAGDDPWGFRDRWYERRKRAMTLAALPRERYASGYEPGCSIGELTVGLAGRCDALLASDVSAAALRSARQRLAGAPGAPGVTLARHEVPHEWPPGPFDLVVLSELGYYLDAPDLARLASVAADSLVPGGTLLACHWRHPVTDYPLGGDEVHAALAAVPGLERTVSHVELDLRLDVFARTPPAARSVAQVGGLA